jgi:hypothetical protein
MKCSTINTAVPSPSSTSARRQRLRLCAAILSAAFATFARCPNAYAETEQITAVEFGEPAPFAGDLFPIRESIAWSLEIQGCYERAALELEHTKAKHDIALEHALGLAAADALADQERIKLLTAELDDARAWYRSPEFVATVAAAGAVAVLLLSTVLVQATGEVYR